jgi:hypothetical protein
MNNIMLFFTINKMNQILGQEENKSPSNKVLASCDDMLRSRSEKRARIDKEVATKRKEIRRMLGFYLLMSVITCSVFLLITLYQNPYA